MQGGKGGAGGGGGGAEHNVAFFCYIHDVECTSNSVQTSKIHNYCKLLAQRNYTAEELRGTM